MGTAETVASLSAFAGRGAGTNAERRAAGWLARELDSPGRETTTETFWCRPNWALAHAWHVLLAVAGSLLSVASPRLGGALIVIALVSLVLDATTGVSLGRRLTPEHASQNVASWGRGSAPVRLIITANYDAGRTGLVYRRPLRRFGAALNRPIHGPGWLGWLAVSFICVLVTAILRDRGSSGTLIGAVQLAPTAVMVLALALLLDLAASSFGPAAGDNASGVAVALALARALDVTPPAHLSVDLVLQGASDGDMTGLRRHLRANRHERNAADTVVLGLAGCGGGSPRWWISDGALIPRRLHPRLDRLAAQAAAALGPPHPLPHPGRGVSPALPARAAGLPAISIGCLDGDGLAPRSHQSGDTAEALERASSDRLLNFALSLADAIDANLASLATGTATAFRTSA
jgi:hypothetical protein